MAAPDLKRNAVNVLRVASAVADAETVTIGAVVFEFDTASTPTITAGRQRVDINAAQTAAASTTALEAAVNATNVLGFRVIATRISANEVLFTQAVPGVNTTACSETLAGTNNAWAAAAFYGGSNTIESARTVCVASRAATAVEVALETLHFVLPISPTMATVQVVTAAGVTKAFDGAVTISGNRVTVASSGTSDVAATDVVTVVASN